eukprot:1324273-Amorphochlora_amoeboformis.AAC.1
MTRSLEIAGDRWRLLEIAGDPRDCKRSIHPVLTCINRYYRFLSDGFSDYLVTRSDITPYHALAYKILIPLVLMLILAQA